MSTRRFTTLVIGVAALAITGCTKASDSPTVTAAGPSSASVDSSTVPGSGAATEPSSPTATTSAVTTPTSATPSKSTTPPKTSAPVAAGCPASSLTVTVNRGSGVAGHQYATVVFLNKSKASCPLAGFPGIELLAGGAPIGTSVRSSAPATTVTLAPGASASSQLVNDSTCGAAESDSIQVIPPNTSTPSVLPLIFRGCTVTVGPVQPS